MDLLRQNGFTRFTPRFKVRQGCVSLDLPRFTSIYSGHVVAQLCLRILTFTRIPHVCDHFPQDSHHQVLRILNNNLSGFSIYTSIQSASAVNQISIYLDVPRFILRQHVTFFSPGPSCNGAAFVRLRRKRRSPGRLHCCTSRFPQQ